jgi:hypothetical protein
VYEGGGEIHAALLMPKGLRARNFYVWDSCGVKAQIFF